MGSYFRMTGQRGKVVFTRVANNSGPAGEGVIYLDADPASGVTWLTTADLKAVYPQLAHLTDAQVTSLAAKSAFYIDNAFKLTTDTPATKSTATGANAVFTVVAAGGITPYTYQWYWNGIAINAVDNGQPFNPSAITATLTNSAVTAASAGAYWCVVKDSSGLTIESTHCVLTVTA